MGRWPPGAALRQDDLAKEFGVSRIPVREALQTLQSEGLIQIEPNRGAFVASCTGEQLTELFDLRVMLEVDALKRAIPQHTERTIRRIEAIQRDLDQEDEAAQWVRLDRAFHEELYAPSARGRTLQLIAGLRVAVERFYLSSLGPNARRAGWSDEHQQLIAALKSRRSSDAAKILTSHLRQTQQLALASLGSF